MGVLWRASMIAGWIWCVGAGGCVSPSLNEPPAWLLEHHAAATAEVRTLRVRGDFTIASLARLISAAYGISLSYSDDLRERVVSLNGAVTETELQGLIELQVGCQVIVQGRVWSLVGDGERFAVVVSGALSRGLAGIADVAAVGGRYVASGEMSALPALRRIVDAVEMPRAIGRVRLWLVERAAAERLALSISPAITAGYDHGWFADFQADLVADVFARSGVVEREIELLCTDGEPLEYRDQTEVRVERFVAAGDSGQTFRSESEVLAAGLGVLLTPVRLGRVWRLSGQVEVSDFTGGGGDIPDRTRRTLTIEVDMGAGSCVRLGRVQLFRDGHAGGLMLNSFSAGKDRSSGVFDIWAAIDDVVVGDAAASTAAAREPVGSSEIPPPEPGL